MSIEDKAMASSAQPPGSVVPFVRTFLTSNSLILKDGQSRQYTTAADRVTGELVKVDVTLKVVK